MQVVTQSRVSPRAHLSADNEFYYDEGAKRLYYHSSKGAPSGVVEAIGNLKTLIRVVGSQNTPVRGISLLGVVLRDAALTYLDEHSMPSGKEPI